MSVDGSAPIVSGRPYTVVEVSGRPATHLDEFVGATSFIVEGDGTPHLVPGIGAVTDTSVRFHQKDPEHHGKDVRIWIVSQNAEGGFSAEHVAAI